ncbi:MAG: hypothetical protein PHH70_00665 [Candidatus Gracilibacteria bacterium]|nr:hypothetical protein [Candidatus Gracilibacteria bacterium]
MSENQDGVKINQSLTDAFSEFCEISNKTIAHLPLEFSEQSALYGDIYLIRSEFSDGSVMYFPELQITFNQTELFEPALIPYSLRERYFIYNGPLKDVDDDKEARCQFLLECLKEKEILREMTEMLEFGMRRFFDQNEIGEFLESQQNKFIGRCDPDEDVIGNGERQFLVDLDDHYAMRYTISNNEFDSEFGDPTLLVDPFFIDRNTSENYRMHEVFPPYIVESLYGHLHYECSDPIEVFQIVSESFLNVENDPKLQKRIRVAIEYYEKFLML